MPQEGAGKHQLDIHMGFEHNNCNAEDIGILLDNSIGNGIVNNLVVQADKVAVVLWNKQEVLMRNRWAVMTVEDSKMAVLQEFCRP